MFPICMLTERLGEPTCSCQGRFAAMDWIEDTQTPQNFELVVLLLRSSW